MNPNSMRYYHLVIDCTASWCGPYKLAPLVNQLAEEYSDRINVCMLDPDASKALASQFAVKSIPAVMFFSDGELKETLTDVQPYDILSTKAASFLS